MFSKPTKSLCIECNNSPRMERRKMCATCIRKKEKERARAKKIAKESKIKERKEKKVNEKRLSRTNLMKEADRVWSLYIRERDRGNPCITCGTPWNETHQAGHFMSRRHLNTRWLTSNGASQCPKCNCWGAGEQYEFSLALEKKSPGLPEAIRRLALLAEKTTDEEILTYIRGLYNDLSELGLTNEQIKIKKYYLNNH